VRARGRQHGGKGRRRASQLQERGLGDPSRRLRAGRLPAERPGKAGGPDAQEVVRLPEAERPERCRLGRIDGMQFGDRRHVGGCYHRGTLAGAMLALLLLAAAGVQSQEWTPLFNGKDLDGWVVKIAGLPVGENYADTFRVEDGILQVRYDGYEGGFQGRFGHLFTLRTFSRYRLRVVYRFVGEQCPGGEPWAWRNSGAMLHAQSPWSMALGQGFPVSVEAQFLGGDGTNSRPTGNVCTPGTNVVMGGEIVRTHCVETSSETRHGEGWVTFEAEVFGGGEIHHMVDGKRVSSYSAPQLDERDGLAKPFLGAGPSVLDSGHIALQAESHPIDFRSVEIMLLD
jgi:hypothetical protein